MQINEDDYQWLSDVQEDCDKNYIAAGAAIKYTTVFFLDTIVKQVKTMCLFKSLSYLTTTSLLYMFAVLYKQSSTMLFISSNNLFFKQGIQGYLR